MHKKTNTLIVNFFAGPGAGKSTLAAAVFAELKWRGVLAELVREYAKDLVWAGNLQELGDRRKVFNEQLRRQEVLYGQVAVVVTDSPLLLALLYGAGDETCSQDALRESFARPSLNYFVERRKPYDRAGRLQDQQQAEELDVSLRRLLDQYGVTYRTIEGRPEAVAHVADDVQGWLCRTPNQ